MLITIEGPDGGGKTTLANFLEEKLKESGLDVVRFREPGGTKIGEQIRDIVHSLANTEMASLTEALLYQAARAQIVVEKIRPALDTGKIVLMDRFFDSSTVYQGEAREIGVDIIDTLNHISTGGLTPDVTLLLDVDAKIGIERNRRSGVDFNRLDAQAIEFHQKVRDAYLMLASQDETRRWIIIDGSKSINEVASQAWSRIESRLVTVGLIERPLAGTEKK